MFSGGSVPASDRRSNFVLSVWKQVIKIKKEKRNMYSKKDIIGYIFSGLCFIGLLIYSIIAKKYPMVIFLLALVVVVLVVLAITSIASKKTNKKIVDNYRALKEKPNKTVFDELYILAYQEKLDELLSERIKRRKIKDVSSIVAYTEGAKSVEIGFIYRGFDFSASINEKNIQYQIRVATRYGLLNNNEIEKKHDASNLLEEVNCLDDLIDNVCELTQNVLVEINNYCDLNKVDEVFNGRLNNKINDYISDLKQYRWLYIFILIIGILLVVFSVIFIVEENPNVEVLIMFLMSICAGAVVSVFSTISTIYYFAQYRKVQFDLKNKQTSFIEGKPKRVFICRELLTEFPRKLRYIKLYFENKKVIIPLTFCYLNKRNFKQFYSDCKKLEAKLTYLSKSNVAISGEERFIKLVRK